MNSFFKILSAGFVAVVSLFAQPYREAPPIQPIPIIQESRVSELELNKLVDAYVQKKLGSGAVYGTPNVMPAGLTTYNIGGSGVSATATVIPLASLTLPQTGQKLIDSDFSSTFYLTLEPNNRAYQEFVSCTTVTQNANNTASLSGCTRGLSPITPYTASTTLRFPHGGGTQVVFSNPPHLYNEYSAKANDESITGIWTWASTSPPRYAVVPAAHMSGTAASSSAEFASIAYVNNSAAVGCGNASETTKGCVELATLAEAEAGTSSGTAARLVIPASIATSTCQTVQTSALIASSTTGKLSGNCFDTNYPYTITASTTFSVSPSIAASTSSALTLNGIQYAFPSTSAASSSILMLTGGTKTEVQASPAYSRRLCTASGDVTNSGAASTTLMSCTLPANALGNNGVLKGRLYFNGFGTQPGNFIVGITANGTSIGYASSTLTQVNKATPGEHGYIDFSILAAGASNSQESNVEYAIPDEISLQSSSVAWVNRTDTSAIDFTAAQTIAIVQRFGTSGAQTQLVFKNGYMELAN